MQPVNRNMPVCLSRRLLLALQKEISTYTLDLMIQQAEISSLQDLSFRIEGGTGLESTEYARLLAKVRNYFGNGARGLLTRVGRTAWNDLTHHSSVAMAGRGLVGRIVLRRRAAQNTLEELARQLQGDNGQISIHRLDTDLYLVDHISDATYGQISNEPICYTTLGLMLEALTWGTGLEYDVEEIACRAKGAEACKFRVRE